MKFNEFLRSFKMKNGFASARALFESLGGEKKLQMTLRHFQLIESGDQIPTPKVFATLFQHFPRDEYKDAVLSFFESSSDSKNSSELLEYLRENLAPAYLRSEKSIWESNRPRMTYSEEQMQFLTKTPEAMRLQHRLMLWEEVSKKDLTGREDLVKKMIDHDLALWEGSTLKSSRTLFRVPKYEDSAPSAARKGTRYLLAHLDTYLSEEGGPDQEVTYAIQLVTPSIAKTILEEMVKFKKWVQGVASEKTSEDQIPFLFLGFGKSLKKWDF